MTNYISKKYINLLDTAKNYKSIYQQAVPFPSIVFKDFFNEDILEKVLSEFPDLSEKDATSFDHPYEKKLSGKGEVFFGPETKNFMHYLNSQPFLEFLQNLTGIKETLIGDPYFSGGGQHEIKKGGLLKVHADFNKHALTNLDRRLNVLVYLNKDWKDEYGGHFELWNRNMTSCVKRVLPEFNTLAMFSTTDYSYHGHPDPLTCPDNMSRKSLALYYYTNGRPASEITPELVEHNTLFKARVGNQNDQLDFSVEQNSYFKKKIKMVFKKNMPPALLKFVKSVLKK